jgi:hypothetical protein
MDRIENENIGGAHKQQGDLISLKTYVRDTQTDGQTQSDTQINSKVIS